MPALLGMYAGQRIRDVLRPEVFRKWFFASLVAVGTVSCRDDDLVAGPEVLAPPGVGDEVDRLGRAARPDHLGRLGRVQEARDLRARPLERIRGADLSIVLVEQDVARALRAGSATIREPAEVSAGFGDRKVAFLRSPSGWIFEIAQIHRHRVPVVIAD